MAGGLSVLDMGDAKLVRRNRLPIASHADAAVPATDKNIGAGTAVRPCVLFVLGMGRSGTSALTRVLSLCGATLPAGMMGADEGNKRGYGGRGLRSCSTGKSRSATAAPGGTQSLRMLENDVFDANERAACIADIGAYLKKLPSAPVVVVKDLNIVVLSDMWFEAAHLCGLDVAAVIAVRHPHEVIRIATAPARRSLAGARKCVVAQR